MTDTTFFKQRSIPTYEGLQFTGKNSKEVAAFIEGLIAGSELEGDTKVKAGGSYVKLTWPNGVESIVRKNWWVLSAGDHDVSIFTPEDVDGYFRVVAEPKRRASTLKKLS